MKPGIPWSVKGIDQEAREAAKDAARRSGMTLGEWLNALIREQVEETEGPDPRFGAPPRRPEPAPARTDADIKQRLDQLAEQLTSLTRRETETASNRFVPHAVHAAEETNFLSSLTERLEQYEQQSAATLESLLERIDRSEEKTVSVFDRLSDRVDTIEKLGRELAARPEVKVPKRPEEVPGFPALESALRNVVDHIELSEKRTRDAVKALQDRLGEMAARTERAENAHTVQTAPAIVRLDQRLNELAARLATDDETKNRRLEQRIGELAGEFAGRLGASEETLGRRLDLQIGREAAKLSERIDAVRAAGDNSLQKAQTLAVQSAQREAREVEKRLQSVIAETERSMRSVSEQADQVRRLAGEVESLDQRFADIKAESASVREVQSLRLALEQLSATVAQGPDLRPLAEVERRLNEFGRRLEDPPPSSRLVAAIDGLEARVQEIDGRLKEAMVRTADSVSLATFESQLLSVNERLGATEHRLEHVAALDRSVAQLYASIEESRTFATGAADAAARGMAERIFADPRLKHHQPQGPSPELKALEAGLQAVKASAEGADRRTQEALAAVHETLEQIVNKLSDIEAREAAAAAARQVQAQAEAPAPEPERPAFAVPAFDLPSEWPRSDARPHTPSPEAAEPVPQAAFDPGPIPVSPAPAAEYAIHEVPESAPAMPIQEPQLEPAGDDFIAAARRAAQAAPPRSPSPVVNSLNMLSQRLSAPSPGSAAAPLKKASRFSLPFLSGRGRQARAEDGGRRRRLILAGLLLLAAVAAYASRTYFSEEPRPPAQNGSSSLDPAAVATVAPDKRTDSRSDTLAVSGNRSDQLYADPQATASLAAPKEDAEQSTAAAEKATVETTAAAKADSPVASQRGLVQAPTAELPPEIGTDALRQAAVKGDSSAEFIIATRYLEGKLVPADLMRAAQWFERAAAKGLAPAQYRLGTLFERGRGVVADRRAAQLWYERAAEQGNVKSMHNLAVLYSDTQAGTPEYDLAAFWFRKAASHGLKDSQYNMAILCERGLGVAPSQEEAYFWYSLAAKQNDTDAGARAQALEAALIPDALAKAKERLAAWQPTPPDRASNSVAVADPAWQISADQSTSAQINAAISTPLSRPLFGRELIKRAQELLASRGFDVGSTDGVMGSRTANAVRLFQMQKGLQVNGMISGDLVRVLESEG